MQVEANTNFCLVKRVWSGFELTPAVPQDIRIVCSRDVLLDAVQFPCSRPVKLKADKPNRITIRPICAWLERVRDNDALYILRLQERHNEMSIVLDTSELEALDDVLHQPRTADGYCVIPGSVKRLDEPWQMDAD